MSLNKLTNPYGATECIFQKYVVKTLALTQGQSLEGQTSAWGGSS